LLGPLLDLWKRERLDCPPAARKNAPVVVAGCAGFARQCGTSKAPKARRPGETTSKKPRARNNAIYSDFSSKEQTQATRSPQPGQLKILGAVIAHGFFDASTFLFLYWMAKYRPDLLHGG
jgi:hypothetical protein